MLIFLVVNVAFFLRRLFIERSAKVRLFSPITKNRLAEYCENLLIKREYSVKKCNS